MHYKIAGKEFEVQLEKLKTWKQYLQIQLI